MNYSCNNNNNISNQMDKEFAVSGDDREAGFIPANLGRFSVLVSCFCMIHSASTLRTNSHSSSVFNFSFLPLGSLLLRVIIIKIIIIINVNIVIIIINYFHFLFKRTFSWSYTRLGPVNYEPDVLPVAELTASERYENAIKIRTMFMVSTLHCRWEGSPSTFDECRAAPACRQTWAVCLPVETAIVYTHHGRKLNSKFSTSH